MTPSSVIDTYIDHIDDELIIEITKKIVAMDSQNPPGKTVDIAKYLAKLCKKLGFTTKIIPIDEDRHNILAYFGKGNRDIVLSGHLDTVPIGDASKWDFPPMGMTEKNGRLYGRGTADMKGAVATLIGVMAALKQSNCELTHRIVFAGTADEEVGMYGAELLKEKGIMKQADGLIIPEATALRVGIAEKGPYWVRVKVKGKAAHGSMPEVGKNAIEGACFALPYLKQLLPETEHELLGKSTCNIGTINGGAKINVVPEECSLECDYRLVPGVDQQEFQQGLHQQIQALSREHECDFSYEITHKVPALSTPPNEPLVQGFLEWANKIAAVPKEPIGLTYGTDAAALIPPKEIPFIIFGPGSPSVIHQTNECVAISELIDTTKIIGAVLIDNFMKK
ncbi:MAG: ArgE/DapE family deacylase [Candidatus Heimdallarchaeota archaeon]|nr:ArgE/DapE family deacylase [Candidatus Heimdallarchaeota archaeon]